MNVRIFWVQEMACMCAQTRPMVILSSERVLGEWSQEPCYLQGKNPLYRSLCGGSNPRCWITHNSEPKTLLSEPFGPHYTTLFFIHVGDYLQKAVIRCSLCKTYHWLFQNHQNQPNRRRRSCFDWTQAATSLTSWPLCWTRPPLSPLASWTRTLTPQLQATVKVVELVQILWRIRWHH